MIDDGDGSMASCSMCFIPVLALQLGNTVGNGPLSIRIMFITSSCITHTGGLLIKMMTYITTRSGRRLLLSLRRHHNHHQQHYQSYSSSLAAASSSCNSAYDVIIVGGGAIGSSIAYHLATSLPQVGR